jgi:hypothetical protein
MISLQRESAHGRKDRRRSDFYKRKRAARGEQRVSSFIDGSGKMGNFFFPRKVRKGAKIAKKQVGGTPTLQPARRRRYNAM